MSKLFFTILILASLITGISYPGSQALAGSGGENLLYPNDQLCPAYDPYCFYGMDNQEDYGY